jgi:glutamine phosphoribosylpyrophosphate amidotransferase
MCGVVGYYSDQTIDINKFLNILKNSMIRGKHATGVAWNHNGIIKTKIVSLPANLLELENIKTNMIIGHARYSTSDLLYNQPIFNDKIAIVHNGVITQQSPEKWKQTYGFDFNTKNDSELILKSWEINKHPINEYPEASIASIVIDLRNKPSFNFFRNEKRPLYYYKNENDIFIASTKDILKRANITLEPIKTNACFNYSIIGNKLESKEIRKTNKDLQ